MFLSSLKVQLKIMARKAEFQIAFLVTLFYACFAFVYVFLMNTGRDVSEYIDANRQIGYSQYHVFWFVFSFLYPFLIVLPFATSYIDDYKNRLLQIYVTRVSRWQYYGSKLLAGFIGTTVMIAVPFLINLFLCNLFLPHNYNTWIGAYQSTNYIRIVLGTGYDYAAVSYKMPFLELYLASPFWYNIVYLLVFSAFSGLLGSFVLGLSFMIKRWKIVLFLPVYLLLRILQTCDMFSYSYTLDGGMTYINYDPLNYVTPNYTIGQSSVFILLVCVMLCGTILLSLVYGVKQEMKSVQ